MRFTSVSISLGKGDLIKTNVYDDARPILRVGDVAIYLDDDDLSLDGMVRIARLLQEETSIFTEEILSYVRRERDKAQSVMCATAFIETDGGQ